MTEAIQKSGPRVHRYRKQIRWLGQFLKWLSISTFILCLILLAVDTWTKGFEIAIRTHLLGIFSSLILFALYRGKYQPLMMASIQVFSDRVEIQYQNQVTQILFENIQSIRSKVYGHLSSGFTLKMRNGEKHWFFSALERSEYIIERIYKSRPELLNEKDYQKLRNALIVTDHEFARVENQPLGKNYWFKALSLIGIPFGCAFYIYHLQSRFIVIHFPNIHILNLMRLGLFLTLIASSLIAIYSRSRIRKSTLQRLQNDHSDKRRDTESENRWLSALYPAQMTCMLAIYFLIGHYDLNLFHEFENFHISPNLKMIAGETLWQDDRYNCLNCLYSLQKGDRVVVHGVSYPGGIIALPGETTTVNLTDQNNHLILADQKVVPENQVAVQFWKEDRPVTELVALSRIKGLLTHHFPLKQRPAPLSFPPSVAWSPTEVRSLASVPEKTSASQPKHREHPRSLPQE